MYRLLFHPEADKEFIEAVLWYEKQKNGLGNRFILAAEKLFLKIQNGPNTFGYSKKPFREASVPIFPYTVVFRVNKKENVIYIVSFFHTRRNPKNKFRK